MFRWGRHYRTQVMMAGLLAIFLHSELALSNQSDPAEAEKKAKELLAQKLQKVSNTYSVKEARSTPNAGNFDQNTGNPSDSNTTYHSYVWDYCLQMAGGGNCKKWLDPYISKHGLEKDNDGQSPLENTVATLWNGMKKEGDKGQGGSYGIWDIQAKGNGSVLDSEGRLDRTQLTKFELKKDVTQKVEQIGYETAARTVSIVFDEKGADNVLPNMESLRLMAGRWTRMMRNSLVKNLGELRANDKGIEFTLGEDLAGCEKYLQAVKRVPDEVDPDKIKYQAKLDPETQASQLQERYNKCMAARNASVYMVNAKVQGGKAVQGNQNEEQIDKWRSRVNIATIDYGGIDPNNLPKPADQPLTEKDVTSEIADWNEGGTEMKAIRVSNGDQIDSYNRQLATAAQGMKEAAARSPFIPDASSEILQNQVKKGTVSLEELNGQTREMKSYLKGTSVPATVKTPPPPVQEDAPSQLTVTAAR